MVTAVENGASVIRILVVDDHTILRQGLCRLIEAEAGLVVCGEAIDGHDAVEKARTLEPDVVLMDLAMPNLTGPDAARRIVKARPRAKVIVVSNFLDEKYLAQALDAGVRGYVLKDAAVDELLRAIRTVARGERFFSDAIEPETIERLKRERRGRSARRGSLLTQREREVMKLLAEGKTVKEVARILQLSQKTVDTHKTNLMKKLSIHNRVELVNWAKKERLINLE